MFLLQLKTPKEDQDSSSTKPSIASSSTSPSESGEPEDGEKQRGPSPIPGPPPVTSAQLVSLVADVDILCTQVSDKYKKHETYFQRTQFETQIC